MSFENFGEMDAHMEEARKILRERFKFNPKEAQDILEDVLRHFMRLPHVESLKNPRRVLLSTVRKFAAKVRREAKAWATRNKNQ